MFNISYFNISLQILKLQNVSENLSVCTISALPQLFTARLVACEWTGSSSDFHQQLGWATILPYYHNDNGTMPPSDFQLGWGTILPVNRFGGQSCRHSTCVDFGRDDDNDDNNNDKVNRCLARYSPRPTATK